jgi:cation:H+ antiporter
MWTGNLKRWHGFVLLALYIAYWVVSYVVYGAPPSTTDRRGRSAFARAAT